MTHFCKKTVAVMFRPARCVVSGGTLMVMSLIHHLLEVVSGRALCDKLWNYYFPLLVNKGLLGRCFEIVQTFFVPS